ncbi:class II glutamine amidotransferase [Aerophototrophica crusticola]|uniref:Class II glutamine amidotransferase n=1 Tax=Aerophototrophica crusticola TaxID=1709002 RepID=A0A858R569_9PROT|nr:class II glutamine amidotransferase [Rhodospirillaceae bacterium B3]
MCRWLAYGGEPIAMDTLLFKPCNSLIRQSLSAQRSIAPTNGDGFGLGWYGHLDQPGLYRDTMPAWNDANLRSLAEQIRSPLFFAHVRASTGPATARLNCHPFRYDKWLFMHNGQVGGWTDIRQAVEGGIDKRLYKHREGSTDSEALFYLLLGHGFAEDPAGAFARAIRQVLGLMAAEGATEPFRMTAACSDGRKIYAVRWSSDGKSPSLYWARGSVLECAEGKIRFGKGQDGVLVLSEPLDEDTEQWTEVPEGSLLVADRGRVEVMPFGV